MPEPEQLRIQRACAGDAGALAELWTTHRAWVASVLLAYKSRGADLDDLLQDVATILVQQISTLRDPAKFRPWLRMIAIHAAQDLARRLVGVQKRTSSEPHRDAMLATDTRQTSRSRAAAELEDIMIRIESLNIDQREVLLLQAVHGMTQKQLAAVLGIPETTVETRLARARRALREVTGRAPTLSNKSQ